MKVKFAEPRAVGLNDVVNLDQPGIERLWLRPRQVDNGACGPLRREFSLLSKDEAFLATTGLRWETILDGERRWCLIENYAVPSGYNVGNCRLALEIPLAYPAAQIDMFYCNPPLSLQGGAIPPATEARETVAGVMFQRWSRHRSAATQWSPATDNLVTHLGLVDEALGREVSA